MLQKIVASAAEQDAEANACQLLGKLSKDKFYATPICEQEASMNESQLSGTKRQRLDSRTESSGVVKVTISIPS